MVCYTKGVVMVKIIVKAAILVCIVLSIYFIVNPSACSNLLSGRVVNSTEQVPALLPQDKPNRELLAPTGDKPLAKTDTPVAEQPQNAPADVQSVPSDQAQDAPTVTDTNSNVVAQPAEPTAPTYSQADVDYAIANRYVELENQYTSKHKDTKNAAKDISYIVMDDFELTPAEWEAFLQRATQRNLFEKVRQEQATK